MYCTICKVTYNTYENPFDNPYSVAKVDYRGAAAPQNYQKVAAYTT